MGNSAFDGAGTPYRGPGYRGAIVVLVVVIVAVALIWYAYSQVVGDTNSFPALPPPVTPAPAG